MGIFRQWLGIDNKDSTDESDFIDNWKSGLHYIEDEISIKEGSEEIDIAKFHLMIMAICAQYTERMQSADIVVDSEKKKSLERLGLTNSKTYLDILSLEKQKNEIELLKFFKENFPNSIFMKLDDFKNLCIKYGLVCGDMSEFKGEIPNKNIKEIIDALQIIEKINRSNLYINYEYYTANHFSVTINKNFPNKFILEERDKLIEYAKNFHFFRSGDFQITDGIGQTREGIFANKEKLGEYRMLIAAPSNLMNAAEVGLEYYEAKPVIKDDPIVFQILNHDIVMIHSKWGEEANDPTLNESAL